MDRQRKGNGMRIDAAMIGEVVKASVAVHVQRANAPVLERLAKAEAGLAALPIVDAQVVAKAAADDAVAPLRAELGVLKAAPAPVIPDPAEAVDKFAQALVTKLLA